MQDKTPMNEQGQYHGNLLVYWLNGNLWINQNCINGELYGLRQTYKPNGQIMYYEYHAI